MSEPSPSLPATGSRQVSPAVLLLAVTLPTLITWVYFVLLERQGATAQQLAYGVGKALQFALPLLAIPGWIAWRRAWRWPHPRDAGVLTGIVLGLLVLLATVALYERVLRDAVWFESAAEQVRAKVARFGIRSTGAYLALGVFYAAVHSALEEYYWRWFVFAQLRSRIDWRWAAVISSLGFMAHHVLVLARFFGGNSPATWFFSACVAVGGLLWAWLYQRSGKLTGPWLSHLLVDAAIFWVGYQLVRSLLA